MQRSFLLPVLGVILVVPTDCRAQDAAAPPAAETKGASTVNCDSQLLEQYQLDAGNAGQGLALTENQYYTATSSTLYAFDTEWNLVNEQLIRIDGVNHLGAIDYHDGYLWAGLLHGPVGGRHNPKLDRSIIAKIHAETLTVEQTWDITKDVTWIDPVCFDGTFLWVGDLSDLGIHRYRLTNGDFVRDGVFRYPREMHFSQGIRVRGGKLYSIHTFGERDGLFEFDIPETLTESVNQPARRWDVQETRMHLEGFDFLPGHPDQIWHAQGSWVDRYRLDGLPPGSQED